MMHSSLGSAMRKKKTREAWALASSVNRWTCDRSVRLSPHCVANGIQNVDEIARRAHVAEQRHAREHFHLAGGDVVNATQLLILSEIFPCRFGRGLDLWGQERLCSRIGEEKQFSPIESEHFRQTRQNLVGRMAFAGLEMSDIRR